MDKSVDMKDTFDKLCRLIGDPRNYGPTPEEKAEIDRIAHEERVLKLYISEVPPVIAFCYIVLR